MEIPLLNQRFELSSARAEALWSEAIIDPSLPEGVYRSADGDWAIRAWENTEDSINNLSLEAICAFANMGFTRLQALGINVLSRALEPSTEGDKIWLVYPFIEGIHKCRPESFAANVRPGLIAYFNQAAAGLDPNQPKKNKTFPYLWDIRGRQNYSEAPIDSNLGVIFLHDIEPHLSTNVQEALSYVRELGGTALGLS